MVKKALKNAIGPTVGLVIGNVLFRLTNSHLFNETWPPIFIQFLLYLVVGYAVSFAVILFIEWVKSKTRT